MAYYSILGCEWEGKRWRRPAALDTEYAMVLPCVEAPAMEDVIRKTPPSLLALNVGAALRRRWRWDLVLIAQHCFAC